MAINGNTFFYLNPHSPPLNPQKFSSTTMSESQKPANTISESQKPANIDEATVNEFRRLWGKKTIGGGEWARMQTKVSFFHSIPTFPF